MYPSPLLIFPSSSSVLSLAYLSDCWACFPQNLRVFCLFFETIFAYFFTGKSYKIVKQEACTFVANSVAKLCQTSLHPLLPVDTDKKVIEYCIILAIKRTTATCTDWIRDNVTKGME